MSLPWHDIHRDLLRSAATHQFQRRFTGLCSGEEALDGFADPVALLLALHQRVLTADRKNHVLTALVQAARPEQASGQVAQTMLLLGLWPGLDALRHRVISRWRVTAGDATEEVLARAVDQIARLDLGRVSRVAATILMNIERDIGRDHCRDANLALLRVGTDADQLPDTAGQGAGLAGEDAAMRLARLSGRDAKLVRLVVVEGQTQAEAGALLGLSEAAARKRVQRAMAKLRA